MKRGILLVVFGTVIMLSLSLMVLAKEDCNLDVNQTNVRNLLDELPKVNDALNSCNVKVPYPFSSIISNQKATIYIKLLGGNTESVVLDIRGRYLKGISKGGSGNGYSITTTECVMDTFLRNGHNFGVLSNSYNEGTTKIYGSFFIQRVLLRILNPFINNFADKHSNEIEIKCDESRWVSNIDA